jgi:site-specific DNA-methyltransferase (adenine-specific)
VPSLKGSSKEKVGHPSQKPLKLIQDLVACSTRKGDQVLDPFLGSGTTAAACENLGRRWTGIENQAKYADMAEARIKDLAAEMALFNDVIAETSLVGS